MVSARSKIVLVVHVNVFCLRNHEGIPMSNARSCRELATLGPFFGASVDRDVVKKSFKNRRVLLIFAPCFAASVDRDVVKKSWKNRRCLVNLRLLWSLCRPGRHGKDVQESTISPDFGIVLWNFCRPGRRQKLVEEPTVCRDFGLVF